MKVYQIIHKFDTYAGYDCDIIRTQEVVAMFEEKQDAEAVCQRYSNPHVCCPDGVDMLCGELELKEVEIIPHSEFDLSVFAKKFAWTEEPKEPWRLAEIRAEWREFVFETRVKDGRLEDEYFNCSTQESFNPGTPVSEVVTWFNTNYPGGITALVEKTGAGKEYAK